MIKRSLLLVGLLSFNCYAFGLTLYTHSSESEIFLDSSGYIRGAPNGGHRALFIELVNLVANDVGQPWEIMNVPFSRGMRELLEKDNVAFFNVLQRESNKDKLKWVGPIMEMKIYLYELVNSEEKVINSNDAMNVTSVCVLDGTLAEQELLKKGYKNLFPHSSYKNCLKMLMYGRVNLIALPDMSVYQELIKTGLCGHKVRKTPVNVLTANGYIAFSRSTSDSVIQKWQKSLKRIFQSSDYKMLEQRMLPKISNEVVHQGCI